MQPEANEGSLLARERETLLARLLRDVLWRNAEGVPTSADKSSPSSVAIADHVLRQLNGRMVVDRLQGQSSGARFEHAIAAFLSATFLELTAIRPGVWHVLPGPVGSPRLEGTDQYAHLASLQELADSDPQLEATLGRDYVVRPDILILRDPEDDLALNQALGQTVVRSDEPVATHASLRKQNNDLPMVHAVVSAKWTIRSDRAQNVRTEALNVIRNRKGRAPHMVAVTGEPLPSRVRSLALGTGDLDCTYHVFLHEMDAAVRAAAPAREQQIWRTMVDGRRLRDISDLPLDLAI